MKNTIFKALLLAFLISESFLHAVQPPFLTLHAAPYNPGLFSVFTTVLGLLDQYEEENYSGFVIQFGKNGLYHDEQRGPNWWRYYFMPLQRGLEERTVSSTAEIHVKLALHCLNNLSRERCYELISRYIRLRPHITEKVDKFVQTKFKDAHVLGIHYRGTDKMNNESPFMDYEIMLNAVAYYAHQFKGKKFRIFVATDEQDFMDEMNERFPGQVLTASTIRSDNGKPLHTSRIDPYKHGEEALIDCLLLSRCNHLIRTSSNLSLCSTYFNPELSVELLNPGILDNQ